MPVDFTSFISRRGSQQDVQGVDFTSFSLDKDDEEKKKKQSEADARQSSQTQAVSQTPDESDTSRDPNILARPTAPVDNTEQSGSTRARAERQKTQQDPFSQIRNQDLSTFNIDRDNTVEPDLVIRKTFTREQLEQIDPDKPQTPFERRVQGFERAADRASELLPSAAEAFEEPLTLTESFGAPFGIDPRLLRATKEDVQDVKEKARAVAAVVQPEAEFAKEYKRNDNKFLLEMGRLATNPKNIPSFVTRAGASAIDFATFGVLNFKDEAKDVFSAEEWVKEARWPEWLGGAGGFYAGGGVVGALGKITKPAGNALLRWGGPTFQRYASYIFGPGQTQALKLSDEVIKGVDKTKAVVRTGQAVARGVAGEGSLGFAVGLAREPEEGESRLQNAIDDAFVFAVGGGLVRGGLAANEIRNTNKLHKSLANAAEAEGVTISQAAETLLKNNPKARSLKDFTPEQIERIKDVETVQVPAQNWLQRNVVGEEFESGQTVFKPTTKLLEKAGKWFYDTNGLKLPFGMTVSLSRAAGGQPGATRRFFFDKNFGAPKGFAEARMRKNLQAQQLTNETAELAVDVAKQRGRIMSEFNVGPEAANKRITQVLEGGVTQDRELYYLGQKYRKLHDPLEKALGELGLIGDTRFIRKSRKKVLEMSKQKEALISEMTRGIPDDVAKPEFQKYLREWEFDTPKQMRELIEQQFPKVKLDEERVRRLFDVSRFIRTSYREAGRVHMRRFYEGHPEGRLAALGFFKKKTGTKLDRAQFAERQDLPPEIRKELGEIEDVVFRAGETINRQVKAVQDGKFLKAIAENKDWAVKKNVIVGGKEIVSSRAKDKIADGWIELKGKQFGDLDGHLVEPFIAKDLSGLVDQTTGQVSEIGRAANRLYKKTLQAWKFGKVVLNPATHMRNMMSNTILLDMSGVGFAEQATLIPRAMNELVKKGPIYKEAQQMGLFGQEFISKEMSDLFGKNLLRAEKNHLEALVNTFGEVNSKGRIKKGLEKLGDFYQGEDQLFKLTKYMHMRGRGYPKDVSLREAEKWLFNYDDIPEAVRYARDYASPFITFISKAAPRTFETVIKQPWKLAKYGIYMNAIGNIGTEDEPIYDASGPVTTALGMMPDVFKSEIHKYPQWRDEAVLPEWTEPNLTVLAWPKDWLPEKVSQEARRQGLTIPRLMRFPMQDNSGRNIYMDFTYMVPFGDLGEVSQNTQLGIPRVFFPQSPVFDAITILKDGKDPFTQKDIALDGDPLRGQKYFQALARAFMPTLAPGGYGWDKVVNAIEERPDYQGRVRSIPWVAADVLLGLKTRPFDLEEQRIFRLKEKERLIEDVMFEIRSLTRKKVHGIIDEDEANEMIDLYIQQIRNIGEEVGTISNYGVKKKKE